MVALDLSWLADCIWLLVPGRPLVFAAPPPGQYARRALMTLQCALVAPTFSEHHSKAFLQPPLALPSPSPIHRVGESLASSSDSEGIMTDSAAAHAAEAQRLAFSGPSAARAAKELIKRH